MKNYANLLSKDPSLRIETEEFMRSHPDLKDVPEKKRETAIKKAMIGPVNEMPRMEAMIQTFLRPAYLIQKDQIKLTGSDSMKRRFKGVVATVQKLVPSVGRIEFDNIPRHFGGTGWLIDEDIVVTNRHVAQFMAERGRGGRVVALKNGANEVIKGVVDFKEEHPISGRRPELEFEIEKVIYLAGSKEPDIAFLKLVKGHKLPPPIPVSGNRLKPDQFISVVGYPGEDPNGIISRSAARSVFDDIYEVKRCSPGEVLTNIPDGWYFFHDATTLGGNSGSVVIDNASGEAIGLHFMGELEKQNYAVKMSAVLEHAKKAGVKPKLISVVKPGRAGAVPAGSEEAPVTAEDYEDREGYDSKFLGEGMTVQLPTLEKSNVALAVKKGTRPLVLHYHHFSVVMNKKRQMCFYSICNIDGQKSKRGVKRATWRNDPRLLASEQLHKDHEGFGNAPLFSRGHMTRKEDPIWGTLAQAQAAGKDTFHMTNAVPQIQGFNAPVWLALEDYALENSRQDKMRITVITGPIFDKNDPVRHGMKVPVDFFKIIAFEHDETGELCATGYTVSQAEYLTGLEFVFGEFKTYQVSIRSIEKRTKIKFGRLASVDPLEGQEAFSGELRGVGDVVFVRGR